METARACPAAAVRVARTILTALPLLCTAAVDEFGDPLCVSAGECELCSPAEDAEPYCQATGRRREFSCAKAPEAAAAGGAAGGAADTPSMSMADATERSVAFRPCTHTTEDDFYEVGHFSLSMAALGGVAMYLAQKQKQKHTSLFDQHKQRAGGR